MIFLPHQIQAFNNARIENFPRANLYFSLYFYMLGKELKDFLVTDLKVKRVYVDAKSEALKKIEEQEHFKDREYLYLFSTINSETDADNLAIDMWKLLAIQGVQFYHHYDRDYGINICAVEIDAPIKDNFKKGLYSKMYDHRTVEKFFGPDSLQEHYDHDLELLGKTPAKQRDLARKRLFYTLRNDDEYRDELGFTSKVGECDDLPLLDDETLNL